MSKAEALSLKEAIEEKSDQSVQHHEVVGELVGIDVDWPNTYFHIKTIDGRDLQGKLGSRFLPLENGLCMSHTQLYCYR